MSSGLYSHTTRGVGTVLTSAIYNSDHTNHITNHNPLMMGGHSDSVGQMQAKTDPGGLGSEALASSLSIELEQIRFAIARIQGTTHWYQAAVTSLAVIGGGIPLSLAFAATPLTLRRTENTTAEVEVRSVQSGSGAGNKFSTRIVGSAANAVAEVREFIGATELFRQTIALRTHQLAEHFNANVTIGAAGAATRKIDISGFDELTEITPPANPAANKLRIYAKDLAGVTVLCYRDSAGVEYVLSSSPFADQAEMEAAASAVKVVSPLNMGFHPGMIKAWGNGNGLTLINGFNIASVTNVATTPQINFTNPMVDANYFLLAIDTDAAFPLVSSKLAGSFRLNLAAGLLWKILVLGDR